MKGEAPPSAGSPNAAPVAVPADHSGDVETRLRRLEDNYAKYSEALDFLGKVYAQQKQQQAQQAEGEHDPETRCSRSRSSRTSRPARSMVPRQAPVTVIKAFDFACPYCQRTASTWTTS